MDATAVVALRRARRRNRLAAVERFDAFYRAYIVVLLSGIATAVGTDIVGGVEVDESAVADVLRRGPALLGLIPAVGLLLGMRSGARGGPLGIERADVRHLLLAPVDRRAVVQPLALKQVRAMLVGALGFGVVAGMLASRRLPGATGAWALTGAFFSGAVVLLATGAAYAVSGQRVPRAVATPVGLALLAWAAADLYSPFRLFGSAALSAMQAVDIAAVVASAAMAVALVVLGLALAPGLSIEAAEHRSKLVGELRFAATLQDIRTVLVLHRQLAQDNPRQRPWVRLPRRDNVRFPTWRRDWHGLLRWRSSRYLRVTMLGASAGLAVRPAQHGTVAFLALSAAALWLAALDVVEPVAQELDHPTLLDSFPRTTEYVLGGHLPAAMAAMSVPAAIAVVLAIPDAEFGVMASAVVAISLTAVCGAVITVVKGPPPAFDPLDLLVGPEIAGFRKIQRLLFPVVVSGIGLMALYDPDTVTAAVMLVGSAAAAGLWLVWLARLNRSMTAS